MAKDLYEILGVSKTATESEIKSAYRKLAQKYHPDRNKDNKEYEEKFKEINGAYEILSDKQKRGQYDQFGAQSFGQGGGGGAGGGFGGFDFGSFGGFEGGFADIFETFFGGGSRATSQRSTVDGQDREISITLTFEEAAFGTEKEIRLTKVVSCTTCNGSGAAEGAKIVTCDKCSGTGEIRIVRNSMLGQMTTRRVCDACGGVGKKPERPCRVCNGAGRVRGNEDIRIKIPAGIEDGATLRITGKGDSGMRGGKDGDLYVHVSITQHRKFRREGSDVYSTESIRVVQGVLGDVVQIETIQGPVSLKIRRLHGLVFIK